VRSEQRSDVAGVLVSQTSYFDATRAVVAAALERRALVAAATSVHGISQAALDPNFREILNSFDLITPDGQPVRWALNLLHGAGVPERVYGPTLMRWICQAAADQGLGVYFYGGRPQVLPRLAERLRAEIPDLRIAGSCSPPFRALSASEDAVIVRNIRDSGASIVFVGLGCPAQERWAFAHREVLGVPLVCVGAAFDFLSGSLVMAPAWMQRRGLEWAFRLSREPARLWRRYAVAIPVFVFFVARQFLASRGARPDPHTCCSGEMPECSRT
jgi:exopolysaccharide biosynthesis WecB/TagA/CpsF family protein